MHWFIWEPANTVKWPSFGLDNRDSIFDSEKGFAPNYRIQTGFETIKPISNESLCVFLCKLKQTERDAGHSSPTSVEFKNMYYRY